MSSLRTGDNGPEKPGRSPGAATPGQANADEILAEFEQVLKSAGYGAAGPPPPEWPAAASAESADIGEARDGEEDSSADGPWRRDPTMRRPRIWTLAASALALGLAAVAGAVFVLMPSAPAPKSPLSESLSQRPGQVQPLAATPVATSNDAHGPLVKDSPPNPAQAAASGPDVGPKEPAAPASAPGVAQTPAGRPNAMTAATPADAPAAPAAPASLAPAPEPVRNGPAGPAASTGETKTSGAAAPAPASQATGAHNQSATPAGVAADPAKPPAAKLDPASRPTPDRTTARKSLAKTETARPERAAGIPLPPPRPAPPRKAAASHTVSPAAQAGADPAATAAAPVSPVPPPAEPNTPASLAAQSIGQVTNAFGYLTRLPGALIERAAGGRQ